MKKLSIITPLYKTKERFLLDAIGPLKKYADKIEWVLVNDSPDDMLLAENLRKIYDPHYMKIVDNEKNIGLFGAYYNGFLQASGEYCCILDHDDVFNPGNVLETIEGEGSDLVYTDEYKFIDRKITHKLDIFHKPDFDILSSVFYFYTHHVTVMRTQMAKVALLEKGIDCGYLTLFDIHLMLEYLNSFIGKNIKTVHVNSADYGWRVHPESTAMNLDEKVTGYFERLRKSEEFFKENHETPLVNRHNEIGYCVEGRFLSAFDELKIPVPVNKFKQYIIAGIKPESSRYTLWHNLGKDIDNICDADWLFLRDLIFKIPLYYLERQCVGTLFLPIQQQHIFIGGQNFKRHITKVPFLVKSQRQSIFALGFKGLWIENKNYQNDATVSCLIQKIN